MSYACQIHVAVIQCDQLSNLVAWKSPLSSLFHNTTTNKTTVTTLIKQNSLSYSTSDEDNRLNRHLHTLTFVELPLFQPWTNRKDPNISFRTAIWFVNFGQNTVPLGGKHLFKAVWESQWAFSYIHKHQNKKKFTGLLAQIFPEQVRKKAQSDKHLL